MCKGSKEVNIRIHVLQGRGKEEEFFSSGHRKFTRYGFAP